MDFYIGQNSTLPILFYDLKKDIELYGITDEMLQNCVVTFSLIDISNNIYIVANRAADLVIEDNNTPFPEFKPFKYKLKYKFRLKDTRKHGNFIAQFKVDFFGESGCGKLTFPNQDTINVFINESITKTDVIKL